MTGAGTIGELRASGYADRSVKEELRANLLEWLGSGLLAVPGDRRVRRVGAPALERGDPRRPRPHPAGRARAGQDPAHPRLVALLDETVPAIEGCEINDHPYRPICAACRARVVETEGDAVPVAWIDRESRYAEKLATPDISVADLIGDVDPIKVAEGRHLADELTIHYGLVPRTNRGIVAINELPDLPERIQVGLFNILEERDVQIRGYKIRLPLDLLVVATANPEDYTHRGRIVSPAQGPVRHAGPHALPGDRRGRGRGSWCRRPRLRPQGMPVHVPRFMHEVLAALTGELRRSPQVNQRSGVSVRYSIGNLETRRGRRAPAGRPAGRGPGRPPADRPPGGARGLAGPDRVRHDRGGPGGGDPVRGRCARP